MQTPPEPTTQKHPECDIVMFILSWMLVSFIIAIGYFLFGVFFADDFIWRYIRIYDASASADFCLMTIEDATMTTFPMVVIGLLIALPFALKLERQISL